MHNLDYTFLTRQREVQKFRGVAQPGHVARGQKLGQKDPRCKYIIQCKALPSFFKETDY